MPDYQYSKIGFKLVSPLEKKSVKAGQMKFLQFYSWFRRIGIARIEKLDQELPRPRPMERKTVSGKEYTSRGLMKIKTVNENQRANNCFMPE